MILTGRELDVMNVLWKRGSATVSEVLDELRDELAYTTVLTILRRLEKKGHVKHRLDGKAHRYVALVQREEAQDSALQRITRKLSPSTSTSAGRGRPLYWLPMTKP